MKPTKAGSAGPVKAGWTYCGPKKKVACKISFSSEITIEELKEFCKQSANKMLKDVHDKLTYSDLGDSRSGKNYRIVCSHWPSDPNNLFHSPTLWPTGMVVSPWKGAIRDIMPKRSITKFLGNLDPTTTDEGIKKEIIRLYTSKNISDIEVKVAKFVGTKKRDDVSNYIVRVSSTGNETPQDIIESLIHESVYVRHWSGPLPSSMKTGTTKQTFTA